MDINKRNQDIVARMMAGDSYADVGRTHGISRERTRQIFNQTASKAEARVVAARIKAARTAKPKPPRKERMERVCFMIPRERNATSKRMRGLIEDWLAGRAKVVKRKTDDGERFRKSVRMPAELSGRMQEKCDALNPKMGRSEVMRALLKT